MSGTRFVLAVMLICCWFALTGCGGNAPPESDRDPETDATGTPTDAAMATDVKLFPLEVVTEDEGQPRSLWGYIDRNGNLAIKPQYAEAGEFHEGRAFVRYQDGHYGIIDENGAAIARTGLGFKFSEGRAAVLLKGEAGERGSEWGYIDRTGKLVIPGPFRYARAFQEGLAVVQVFVADKRLYGFVDATGKMAIPARFKLVDDFSEGLATAAVDDISSAGYIDRSGNFVLEPGTSTGGLFRGGLAVRARNDDGEEWKEGYIDRDGKYVIAPQFAAAYPFSDGRALVKMTERKFVGEVSDWGVIDKSGRFIVPPEQAEITGFREGRAWVWPKSLQPGVSTKCYLIDLNGNRISDTEVDGALAFRGGLCRVFIDKKMGYVDRDGKFIWHPAKVPPQ